MPLRAPLVFFFYFLFLDQTLLPLECQAGKTNELKIRMEVARQLLLSLGLNQLVAMLLIPSFLLFLFLSFSISDSVA